MPRGIYPRKYGIENAKWKRVKKNCIVCNKEIWIKNALKDRIDVGKYCSLKCKYAFHRVQKTCSYCDRTFTIIKGRLKEKGRGKFCNSKCRNKYFVKHKLYKNSGYFQKGCKSNRKGKKFPEQSGKKHWHFKGKTKDSNGYILIYKPNHPFCGIKNKYVFEHRLAVEKEIGRYLKPKETTHHLNEIKDDNHPKNLMVFVSKSAHICFHRNPHNVKQKEIVFDGRKLP